MFSSLFRARIPVVVVQYRPRPPPYSTYAVKRSCPLCGAPLPTALPTCAKCSYIEPLPAATSHFDVFSLPSSPNPFLIDVKDLRERFLQAQRVCHPDAWSVKGEREYALAAAQSSQLNKAYQTLLSPLKRARYILEQHGFKSSETDSLEDPELIMEVMEAREALEEATSLEEIQAARDMNRARMKQAQKDLELHIGNRDWGQAHSAAVKLKYWEGIENAAKDM